MGKKEQAQNNEKGDGILDWIRTLAIGVFVGIFVVVFFFQRDDVDGLSMYSFLKDKDILYTNKLVTYLDLYKRGDIAVIDVSHLGYEEQDGYYIKRIIGLPGETLKIQNGEVYIKEVGASDFYKLDEPYLDEGQTTTVDSVNEKEPFVVTLDENHVFCMGDNRTISHDCRAEDVGPIELKRITGIAFIRVYPFDTFGFL
ncbi:MAG: signal peptidase I [Clostridiales bacterium]|nr:signal peptidase I [Clostridiales bacterium]